MGEPTGMDALAAFLTARYDETEADITRWNSGDPHPGEPHTNDLDGDPAGEHYTMYDDACERCLVGARSSRKVNPYAVHSFGLADLAAKRQILGLVAEVTDHDDDEQVWYQAAVEDVLKLLAEPFSGHPEFQETWRLT